MKYIYNNSTSAERLTFGAKSKICVSFCCGIIPISHTRWSERQTQLIAKLSRFFPIVLIQYMGYTLAGRGINPKDLVFNP